MPIKLETAITDDSIMKPVESKTIRKIGHVDHLSTLIIEFKSGGTYVYDGVPLDLHDKLMQADSHGAFFAKHIKNKFQVTRWAGPAPRETRDFHGLAANLSAP